MPKPPSRNPCVSVGRLVLARPFHLAQEARVLTIPIRGRCGFYVLAKVRLSKYVDIAHEQRRACIKLAPSLTCPPLPSA